MRWLLAPLVLVAGVACHKAASPLSPAAPEERSGPLTFVSGETQQPVAGAHVVVAGQVYSTDDSGRVFVDAPASALDVEAPGFLLRQALLAPTRFTLWPRVSPTGLDEEATGRMVYGCNAPGCPSGGDPLVRLAVRAAVIVPSPTLLADEPARQALEEGARLLSAATEGAVTLSVSATEQPGAVTVTAGIDSRDAAILAQRAGAVTRRELNGSSEIVRASVVFRDLDLARRLPLVLHELGHTFGLGHSPKVGDMMWNGPEIYSQFDYSPRERLAMALMLQRSPGNRYPDIDVRVASARGAGTPRTSTWICIER
jgi:hypothetical protein